MTTDSQSSQEPSVKGKVKCTPLQGTEYAKRRAGVPPTLKYNNLEEWFQDNFEPEVIGETENVEVVRTFYTYRPSPRSDVKIWYADGEFGFYEGLPERVADLNATHVNVEVKSPRPFEPMPRISDPRVRLCAFDLQFPRNSGINPRVELYVQIRDQKTGERRPIRMHEFIETVIHDDDEWKARLPKVLTQWELIFPKGESWGIMRIAGYPESPGPSRHSP
ncbi:hypothetical protein BDM02DRAFT_1186476 [Thelephora ganbajun]|uniref:Uncharacterized protein n=1 Tax=Thelephora ganbajun TaxID=370292 RepID=A0ACB6ZWS1_THEGA|nr:hypothetical protein BDM02DRAFT_1186476 [Thelephora ganbajun]